MKTVLFEFFKPQEDELKSAWKEGIFTFDANVLLNFYRYSEKTAKEMLAVLKHLEPQLWLTNQAALEFLANRMVVINDQKSAYNDITGILTDKYNELSAKLNQYKKHARLEVEKIKGTSTRRSTACGPISTR